MPGPPTPLSGCPLKRLEIHDRLSDSVHDAAPTAAALTLTLEAQRSASQDNNDLVLQVHCGLQRMLSFQLTGLLSSPNGKSDAVSIEKPFQQLCVNSQQHDQKIVATFKEARDFNVAACMLKKFGFQVKDGIPKPDPPSYSHPPTAALGPRLSSITSLPGSGPIGQSQQGSDLTFASMLSSETPLGYSGQVYSHLPVFSSPVSSPTQSYFGPNSHPPLLPPSYNPPATLQTFSQPQYTSFLNPYNVFLGRQCSRPHQPLVGSPLRNSHNIGDADVPMAMSFEHPAYPEQSRFRLIQEGRSFSAPITSPQTQYSQESQNPGGFFMSREPNPHPQIATQSGIQEELSQCSSGTTTFGQLQSEMKQDIHDLMPLPRKLPFVKQGKGAVESEKPQKPGVKSEPSPKKKAKRQPNARLNKVTIEGPKEMPEKKPKSMPKASAQAMPKEKPKEMPAEKPKSLPQASTQAMLKGKPKGIPKAKPKEKPNEVPEEKIKSMPKARTKAKPKETPKEKPKVKPKGVPRQGSEDISQRKLKAKSMTKLKESPQESPKAKPEEKLAGTVTTPVVQGSKPRGRKRGKEEVAESEEPDAKKEKQTPKPRTRTRAPATRRQVATPPSHHDPPASSPSEPTRVPTMLLTDHNVLRKVNEATSKLLQQYESDVARGCEKGPYAKFYADRIHSVRRDFWVAQLMGAESERHLSLMSQAPVVTV